MSALLMAFYVDDFTASSDASESLDLAGVRNGNDRLLRRLCRLRDIAQSVPDAACRDFGRKTLLRERIRHRDRLDDHLVAAKLADKNGQDDDDGDKEQGVEDMKARDSLKM